MEAWVGLNVTVQFRQPERNSSGDFRILFLFPFVLKPFLNRLKNVIPVANHEEFLMEKAAVEKGDENFLIAFLDDGMLVETHQGVIHVLEFLESQTMGKYFLYIWMD